MVSVWQFAKSLIGNPQLANSQAQSIEEKQRISAQFPSGMLIE
jgi:hypothetical protein